MILNMKAQLYEDGSKMCYTYHEFTTVNATPTIQFAMSADLDSTGLETITMEEYPNQAPGKILV